MNEHTGPGAKASKREVILGALQGGDDFLSAQDVHAQLRASGQKVGLLFDAATLKLGLRVFQLVQPT